MRILRLEADVESYASIVLASRREYDMLPIFDGRRLDAGWPRLHGRLTDQPVADFAYLTAGMFACRLSVWETLRVDLEQEVEVLPIEVEPVPFAVINVTNRIDCLDRQRSRIRHFPGSDRVYRVLDHVFETERIASSYLFKVPELRTDVFATEAFERIVTSAGFSGLRFDVVMTDEKVDA